jgi:hypothetical protein
MPGRTTEVRNFAVTTPAGTAQAAPLVTALAMPAREVTAVRIRFPPGPFGTLGLAIGMAGVQVIPWDQDTWLVGNDEALEFALDDQPTSGAWQLRSYNTGIYDHAVQVTFVLLPVGSRGAIAIPAPLQIAPPADDAGA